MKVGEALVELDDAQRGAQPAKVSESEQPPKAPRPSQDVEAGHTKIVEQREPQADISATAPRETEQPKPESPPEPTPTSTASAGPAIPAPPSVRRLARELGVDLTQVKGSEAGGRITAEDVKTFVRERTRRSGVAAPGGGRAAGGVFTTMYGNERREPLPSLRRKIAANMTQAWTTIPHVHQFQDADITDLMVLHKRYAPEFKKRGATLTLTSLFLKVLVHALKLYPQLNATLDLASGEVIYKEYYNIGVAVDTPGGLIVPVVHDVDHKDLFQLSVELADLAERTRKRDVNDDPIPAIPERVVAWDADVLPTWCGRR